MSIFVVRHAKAGSRHRWDGDDLQRPLTRAGERQSAALADRLAGERINSLWSSPYVRCVQTLDPLGERLGLEVIGDERLGEDTPFEPALELLAQAGDGAVLCSHGDLVPDLIRALVRRGTRLTTAPDWRKATVWVLDAPDVDGAIATAAVEPPPS